MRTIKGLVQSVTADGRDWSSFNPANPSHVSYAADNDEGKCKKMEMIRFTFPVNSKTLRKRNKPRFLPTHASEIDWNVPVVKGEEGRESTASLSTSPRVERDSRMDPGTLPVNDNYELKECSIVVERLSAHKLDVLRKIVQVKKALKALRKRELPRRKRPELDAEGRSDPGDAGKEILCHVPKCGFKGKFGTHLELDMHVKRYHQGVKKPYGCQLCSKSFQTWRYLEDHMFGHNGEKPYLCGSCGIRRGTKSLLNRHRRLVHGAQTRKHSFTCKICPSRFDCRRALVDHETTHPEPQLRKQHARPQKKDTRIRKRFQCDMCSFEAKYQSVFKQHMMRHSDSRPVPCHVCDRSFKRMSALTVHMAVHTDERPFHCDVCSKRFKLKKTLANHILLHTGHKPYACHICPKAYPTNTHLAMHMLAHKKKGDFFKPPSQQIYPQPLSSLSPHPQSSHEPHAVATVDFSQLYSPTSPSTLAPFQSSVNF